MRDDRSERLKACIDVETICAEVYRALSGLFPEARDFWNGLAIEEDNHAAILVIASGYQRAGKLHEGIECPLPLVNKTLGLIKEMREKIKNRNISLKEALETSISIEQSLSESYFMEFMNKETDSSALIRLQKLLFDNQSHIEKIRKFIKSMDFYA